MTLAPRSAVIDSHTLIWYAADRWRNLGRKARKLLELADRGEATIMVPAIVLVEVSEAARSGRIDLKPGFARWAENLMTSGPFIPVDLSWEIVVVAEELYSIPERSDRLIAATAAYLGHPLLTRDPAIGAHAGVEVIW